MADQSSNQSSIQRAQSGSSPIAEASIARDIQIESTLDLNEPVASSPSRNAPEHSLSNYYRRPNYVDGAHPTTLPSALDPDKTHLSPDEHDRIIREERSLLKDNNLIPRSRSESRTRGLLNPKRSFLSLRKAKSGSDDEISTRDISETTPLLNGSRDPENPKIDATEIDLKWEEAVLAGRIKTTWQREAKVLVRNSAPLILCFILQYSLTVASIFTIGHIGKVELGAVSLASSKYPSPTAST
jgi:MATE family, multidrug and toxin extrusion protein